MIESLHIAGFKLFRDITLPRLGQLNLFVGENNSGKSCMLQAINLYAGQIPVADIVQVAGGLSEGSLRPWDPVDLTEEGTSIGHPVFDLFHRIGQGLADEFVIEKIGDTSPLRVECRPHRLVRDEQDFIRYVPVNQADATSPDTVEMALAIYRGERRVGLLTRRRWPMLPSRIAVSDKVLNEEASSAALVPAHGFSSEKAASMWDGLVQGPGQELVLDWLRMLDPRIEDLAYVAASRETRVALLKVHGQGRVPLRSMGDGLTKLFHIALAVASASKGVLLIDEFENGLHWSVQEKLWIAVAKAASEFNVQVFSTTHSRDCIEGFTSAVKSGGPNTASVYRLERKGDDVLATNLPLLNVEAAMREHGEVR
ncbi:MAG TPA: ATP-binding protein [Candidatus Sulfopaludibacter sp.]|nr:ATP-binding protein [Candidatus Sulfopaludibacter sp.]